MPNVYIEIAKVIVPVVGTLLGILLGALLGPFVKRLDYKSQKRQEYDKLWLTQKQSRWFPLLRATREFKKRFEDLLKRYRGETNEPPTGESLLRDFCELYLLLNDDEKKVLDKPYDPDKGIYWSHFSGCDPNVPRKDEYVVQHVRGRTYGELNFAESSLYKTVEYLGNAERVRRDLYDDRLILPEAARKEMNDLILDVRESLQGKSERPGGIFQEQQEYIGEAVWSTADCVIANHEFLNKMFNLQSWEQFTNLFRFFVDFEFKLEYEIKDTISALGRLEEKVNQLCSCQSRKEYEALWTRGTFMRFLPIKR